MEASFEDPSLSPALRNSSEATCEKMIESSESAGEALDREELSTHFSNDHLSDSVSTRSDIACSFTVIVYKHVDGTVDHEARSAPDLKWENRKRNIRIQLVTQLTLLVLIDRNSSLCQDHSVDSPHHPLPLLILDDLTIDGFEIGCDDSIEEWEEFRDECVTGKGILEGDGESEGEGRGDFFVCCSLEIHLCIEAILPQQHSRE